MKKIKPIQKLFTIQLLSYCMLLIPLVASSQIGEVLWEDNFDSFDASVWNIDIGDGCDIGLCGWGNQELEWYNDDNVTIEPIPGEAGNSALVFTARNEAMGGRGFTSGKVTSENNLSVHYGLIEVRIKTPDLDTGLWPAAWLLGTSNITWPGKGEIDMMEMGHAAAERARLGHPGADTNSYVGANAIFANEDGSPGSIAFDAGYNQPYIAPTPMSDRFVTYRLYWEPTQMRFTVIDQGIESDLYAGPLPLDPNGVTGVFNRPFFLLMNLAVGGNFTDASVNSEVTAPLPGKMLIDYVRVSQWNGHGSVDTDYGGLVAENGVFGVFTDTTPVNNQLTFGSDAEIYGWGGTVQDGTEAPYEGDNVIAWETVNANDWFGGGVASLFGKDMSEFVEDGSLKFRIKIPADVSFRIGITDNFTNESFVEFPAGENKYGLVRNGNWGQVEIPLVDLAGLIAFQNINYMFAITSIDGSFPSSTFQFAIDDIYWDSGNIVSTIPVTSVSLSPDSIDLTVGENQALEATIAPTNATNQEINWSSNNSSVATVDDNGVVTAVSAGNATVTATTADGNFTDTTSISVENEASTFIPDPTKTYYIINPRFNQKIGADGSQDPFTTAASTTGDNVSWRITASPTAGHYYVDCVGGGNVPRIRSDNTQFTDMQSTNSAGTWTRWNFVDAGNGTFYMNTLGSNFRRLQVNNAGVVKMVTQASAGSWEQFILEEVSENNQNESFSERIEAEDFIAMNGIQTENTSDTGGGLNVGFIDTGDWMGYTVSIPADGTYNVDFRVASAPGNAAVQLRVNDVVLTTANIASTGGWQNWTTIRRTVNLSQGTQTIRLHSPSNGWNINWFEISSIDSRSAVVNNDIAKENSSSTGGNTSSQLVLFPNPVKGQLQISLPDYENYSNLSVIDVTGKKLMDISQIDNNLIRIDTERLSQGVYFLMASATDGSTTVHKFIK